MDNKSLEAYKSWKIITKLKLLNVLFKNEELKVGMVAHIFNPNTEADGSL